MTPRAAQVRFYVDADILGLGKILGALRNDVTYPGDPGAVLHKRHRAPWPSADVLDTDWIPEVAARGWLIVTRDSMILQNCNEIAAIRENNAKMVALNQRDAQTKWGQLEVFMTQGDASRHDSRARRIHLAGHGSDTDLQRTTPAQSDGRIYPALQRRRPHRALQLQPPRPDHPVADLSQERVKRRPVLGGLLNDYERAA
jgi:hypothetical protein